MGRNRNVNVAGESTLVTIGRTQSEAMMLTITVVVGWTALALARLGLVQVQARRGDSEGESSSSTISSTINNSTANSSVRRPNKRSRRRRLPLRGRRHHSHHQPRLIAARKPVRAHPRRWQSS